MNKTMDTWYHMRKDFSTFRLEPEKHRHILLGRRERKQRDMLMNDIEGASYAMEGHKAVVFGDYGRGKTHMCHNLGFQIARRGLKILPIYIKCSAFTSKEPFNSLFREFIQQLTTEKMRDIAEAYVKRSQHGEVKKLDEIVRSEEIALVMTKGLTAVELDVVRSSMRWLGGDPKVDMGLVSKSIRPQLSDSRDFGAVMRGISQMLITVEGKVPVYLIDEAERLQDVTNVDTASHWTASLRELTELPNVGVLFFVGALTRNQLPQILLYDEIRRRIGVANYVEFQNPSRDELSEFLSELFSTCIRKGEVPEEHRDVLSAEDRDPGVPAALLEATGHDPEQLRTYPFTPEAFQEFVEQVSIGDSTQKPSEVLVRVQKIAQRAMRTDKLVIDVKMVEQLASEVF
jgi:hypothetical protein